MSPRYLFRLDDITPSMDWARFEAVMDVLRRHGAVPLLGVVPDNRDPALDKQAPVPDFWERMRRLRTAGAAEFAQHGYQHVLIRRSGVDMLSRAYGFKEGTEFAGDSYEEQLRKITAGKRILAENGLDTPYWFSPNHSYDAHTLQALEAAGFTAVSDGVALFPYESHGLVFIPQQYAKPRWIPFGVETVCLHSNGTSERTLRAIERFLRGRPELSTFSEEVRRFRRNALCELADRTFQPLYAGTWRIKSSLARRLPSASAG